MEGDDGGANFNEFGALDPEGLPIEAVFEENPQPVGDVDDDAPVWDVIDINDKNDVEVDRRGVAGPGMIPLFLGRKAGHTNIVRGTGRKCSKVLDSRSVS